MRAGGLVVVVVTAVFAAALGAGCVDKDAEAKRKAAQEKAMFDAEAKAQAEADAKQAKADYDAADAGCNKGEAEKCVDLARFVADGKGAPKDAAKAEELFAKACRMKSKDGCRAAAEHAGDDKAKLAHLTSLCDLGDLDGCMGGATLADTLAGQGALPQPKKPKDGAAVVLLAKACGLGGALACTARGRLLAADDAAEAVASFTRGCDDGEPTSCFELSQLYKAGKGVKKKDAKKAAALAKKACDAGLKDACG